MRYIFLVAIILGINYNGNIKFENEFKMCENNEWSSCISKLYENSGEMWRLYTIKDRFSQVRGLLYYGLVSPGYTDGQILSMAYIIVPHILTRFI